MKTKIVTLSARGDVGSVLCPTHGRQSFVAGFNAPVSKEPQLISCPFCLPTNPSGEIKVGDSFMDSKGVLYVVGVHGNYRIASKLTGTERKRLRERRILVKGR